MSETLSKLTSIFDHFHRSASIFRFWSINFWPISLRLRKVDAAPKAPFISEITRLDKASPLNETHELRNHSTVPLAELCFGGECQMINERKYALYAFTFDTFEWMEVVSGLGMACGNIAYVFFDGGSAVD